MKATRRQVLQSGTLAALAFAVGGKTLWLSPAQAREQGLPLQTLTAEQVASLERLAEILVPGARAAGLAHFLDQQLSTTTEDCLLGLRYLGVEAPYLNFYASALKALDASSQSLHNKAFAEVNDEQASRLTASISSTNPDAWQGPPAPFFFFVLRGDACDVVYGTEQGFANLGIPYMPHLTPPQSW